MSVLSYQLDADLRRVEQRNREYLMADLARPSGILLGVMESHGHSTPEDRQQLELAWIDQYGDAAMRILESEAYAEEKAREWRRWEAEAVQRIGEVFP